MKVKVSLVSYLNTLPFLYGIKNAEFSHEIDLQLDIPSVCAQKLINDEVDLGLVPVAVLPQLKEYYIVSDYCIGASGKVNSVLLLSDVPLSEIKEIHLDYQSKTSVNLVKVLAKHLWKIQPDWKDTCEGFENNIGGTSAGVIIGDRTFNLPKSFHYQYDLSEEWEKLTQLPFAFACWVSNKKLAPEFIQQLNNALKLGLENIPSSLSLSKETIHSQKLLDYLQKDIDYALDPPKTEAIQLFLDYLSDQEEP